jgi:hypothetical protein
MFIRNHSRSPAPHSPQPQKPLTHTPSLSYQAKTPADLKTDEHLQEMVRYRERKGEPHPDLPLRPAGSRQMTPDEAAATRLFRERYFETGRKSDIEGSRWDFDRHEYCQTYRREGEEIVANQADMIVGGFNYVAPQSGRFPPGTRVDIHSHPNLRSKHNGMPSDLDQRVAHQLRTNALHRPGTQISGAIMYYPPKDVFYGYTGELVGLRKRPEFHELVDTLPMTHGGAPDISRMRLRVPSAPRQYLAYNPLLQNKPDLPSYGFPAFSSGSPPERPAGFGGRGPSFGSDASVPLSPPTRLAPSPNQFPAFGPAAPFPMTPTQRPVLTPFQPDLVRGYNTPPVRPIDRQDEASSHRRALSADSRQPASDKPVLRVGDLKLHAPKPKRAADIKAMPPLPQWEAITGAIEELSLDEERGRPGFGQGPVGITRQKRVTSRSHEGSSGPRQAHQPGEGSVPPMRPGTPLPTQDRDSNASLRRQDTPPMPTPRNEPPA